MSSIPDLYLKFLAEKESIEELNSFTGHQFKAKSSLDDLKRTTHFYNLTILVFFSLSWLSRNILVLLASICWSLVIYYVTILFRSGKHAFGFHWWCLVSADQPIQPKNSTLGTL